MKKLTTFLCCSLLFMSLQSSAQQCLIAHYPLNGDTTDISGNNYHATSMGGTFTTDSLGNANSAYLISGNTGLNGSNKFLNLPNMVDSLTNLSVSLWVRHDSYSTTDYEESYVSFGTLTGMGNVSTSVGYHYPTSKVRFFLRSGGQQYLVNSDFTAGMTGTWQHYVMTYDGATGLLKAYVNGSIVGSYQGTPGPVEAIGDYAAIGKHWWANGAGQSTRINGAFDELKVYQCALDSNEVLLLFDPSIGTSVENFVSIITPVKVFPNPMKNHATLKFNNTANEKNTLIITDSQGRIVRTITNIDTGVVNLDRKNLASGIYFFQLKSERQINATGKLVIE